MERSLHNNITWFALQCGDDDLADAFGGDHQEEGESDHQGGERVDSGDRAPADGAFHIYRQGIEAASGSKERDDEIIDGEGKCQEGSGDNPRHHQGKLDFPKYVRGFGTQILGGFHQRIIEAFQPALDYDNRVGYTEGNVGDQHGEHPGVYAGEIEK